MLFELQEESQQLKHGSMFCLCVKTMTVSWAMLTCLTLNRIFHKQDEHCVNRDRLQSPPPFVI